MKRSHCKLWPAHFVGSLRGPEFQETPITEPSNLLHKVAIRAHEAARAVGSEVFRRLDKIRTSYFHALGWAGLWLPWDFIYSTWCQYNIYSAARLPRAWPFTLSTYLTLLGTQPNQHHAPVAQAASGGRQAGYSDNPPRG